MSGDDGGGMDSATMGTWIAIGTGFGVALGLAELRR